MSNRLNLPFVIVLVLSVLVMSSSVFALESKAPNEGVNPSAMMHDSRNDLYRLPAGAVPFGTEVTLRLRAGAGELDAASMRVYDLRNQSQEVIPMTVVTTTPDGFDFWQATVTTGDETTILYYRFILQSAGVTFYYEDDVVAADGEYLRFNKGGEGEFLTTSRDGSYQITVYEPGFYTPEWARNAVFYQIFPDRFRDGDPSNNPTDGSDVFYGNLPLQFHETWNERPMVGNIDVLPDGTEPWNSDFFGGDLAGVIEKLDYLQALGVTVIYMNPIFEARSNHRYDAADFLAVDPMLGTLEDFETLIAETEARGMHVILDGVFNHMSSDSRLFDRYHRYETVGACESVDSEFRSWFTFREPAGAEIGTCVDENGELTLHYDSWWNIDSIPRIDNTIYAPRAYLVRGADSVTRTWGERGIGGWRMDVGGEIDDGRDPDNNYWEFFRKVVRSVNPEALIIGEEWNDATPWLLGDEWDSVMNYRFRRALIGLLHGEDYADSDGLIHGLTPAQFDNAIRGIEEDYPAMAYGAMLNLVGSHDTSRIFFVLGNNPELLKLTGLIQFTLPGAPMVYYGDEIAIDAASQLDGSSYRDDPYNRATYPWPDTEGDYYPPPNNDMLAYYQTLGQMRNNNPALREGEMITLRADDTPGVYAFLRLYEGWNIALVAMNTSDETKTVELDLNGLVVPGLALEGVFGENVTVGDDGMVTLALDAQSGDVWTYVVSIPLFEAPAAPAMIDGAGETGAVSLSWDAVEGAAGYLVYRSPVADGGFEPISDMIAETAYRDTTITNGFVYHYAVASVDERGLVSDLSASVTTIPADVIASAVFTEDVATETTVALAYGLVVPVQAAVTIEGVTGSGHAVAGVFAEAALGNNSDPAWQTMDYTGTVDGADVYATELALWVDGEFTLMVRFSTDAGQTWTEAALADGAMPTLVVEHAADVDAPAVPTDVAITQASMAGVDLAWAAVAADDLAAYRIYRSQDEGDRVLIAELAPDALNYSDAAVTQGSNYVYAITAVDLALNESEQAITRSVQVDRSQFSVTFLVHVPEYTEGPLYLAGDLGADFPNWDPAGIEMAEVGENAWAVTLDFTEGATLQYKFARGGSWEGVEKDDACAEIPNRRLSISLDTLGDRNEDGTYTVDHTVTKWRDLDACG